MTQSQNASLRDEVLGTPKQNRWRWRARLRHSITEACIIKWPLASSNRGAAKIETVQHSRQVEDSLAL